MMGVDMAAARKTDGRERSRHPDDNEDRRASAERIGAARGDQSRVPPPLSP
jgi:hypothetical protein